MDANSRPFRRGTVPTGFEAWKGLCRPVTPPRDLTVGLFTDGADRAQIIDMMKKPWIKDFTTNPSLIKIAGVTD